MSLVAHAWAYSFFWTAAAHIYLWLRHEVDGTPWEDLDPPGVPASALITASIDLPAAGPPVASPVASE